MGIGDWFKRFKRNAAEYEQYREGAGDTESQSARAAHERQPASGTRTPASDGRDGAGGEGEDA
jgi:hypothetical protein